jgi:hypothetical protein
MLKKCSKCQGFKNVEGFSKDRDKFDGLTSACRECNNKREKKRRENGGEFTKAQKLAIYKKCGNICQICNSTSNLQIDHKISQHICKPNTSSVVDNAWVLCKSCNIAKGTRLLIEVNLSIPVGSKPKLLEKYYTALKQGKYEKVQIRINGKQFTEVKFK